MRKRTACGRCPSHSGVHRSNCASIICVLLAVVCLTHFQFLHQLYYRRRHPCRAICLHSSRPSACFNVRCSAVVCGCILAFIVALLPLKLVQTDGCNQCCSVIVFFLPIAPSPPLRSRCALRLLAVASILAWISALYLMESLARTESLFQSGFFRSSNLHESLLESPSDNVSRSSSR
jgi:hypothetical protein